MSTSRKPIARLILEIIIRLLERGFSAIGFSISIQASSCHYCEPRRTFEGPYTEVELGFPSCSEELLIPYMEDDCCKPENTVYPYVPVEVVDKVIKKHGGIVYDVGE